MSPLPWPSSPKTPSSSGLRRSGPPAAPHAAPRGGGRCLQRPPSSRAGRYRPKLPEAARAPATGERGGQGRAGEGREVNHTQRPLPEDCRGYVAARWQRMRSGGKSRDLPPSQKPKDARVLPKHFQPPKLSLKSSGWPSGLMLSFQAPQKGHKKRGAEEEPVLLLGW